MEYNDILALPEYNDDNYEELVNRTNELTGGVHGAIPRTLEYDSPEAEEIGLRPVMSVGLNIPDPTEWQRIIERCHAEKVFPIYHQDKTGLLKNWDQDGLGYCWAWSLTATVMGTRAVEGQKPILLAPVSLGYSVNWRNAGNYLTTAIADAKKYGIAPQEYVPGKWNRNPASYKEGWREAAMQYRPIEWWDVNARLSATSVIGQCLAIMALGRPLYIAYNWWGHAVEGVGLVWNTSRPYNVEWLIQNSHNDGVIRLSGSRGIPSEAYGIRAITFAG